MRGVDASLLVFDVETTGLRRDHDQVIELAVQAGLDADAPRQTWRFRPEVPIDPAAQRVHGITLTELAGEQPFVACAAPLHRLFSRAEVLIGYNVGFDIDMLQAEFWQARLGSLEVGRKHVIDAYRLWQRMEPRGLQQAHQRFVGTGFEKAHRAQADVAATAAVLAGMLAAFGLETAEWSAIAALCAPIPVNQNRQTRRKRDCS